MNRKYVHIFLVILFCCAICKSRAQNINGEQIYVSAETLTYLKFNSEITNYQFGDNNSYTCQIRDKGSSLVIRTIGDTAVSTNLYITEGKRGHLFNVIFLPKVDDINKIKLTYDYSDLKYLRKLIEQENNRAKEAVALNNAAPPSNNTSSSPGNNSTSPGNNSTSSNTNTQASDSAKIEQVAQAAKAKAEAEQELKRLLAEQDSIKIAQAKADLEREQKEQAEKIAKEKAAAEAARKAEEQRLAQEKAELERQQKEEAERIAKAKADAEAARKAEEQRLAKAKADAEAARKAEQLRLAQAKADSIQKAESARLVKARLDSIQAQRVENARRAKATLDSINARKAENERLAKATLDSIQKAKALNERLAKAKADSITARKKREADSLAALPKFYTHVDLWKKYPNIVFGNPPVSQTLAGDYFLEYDTLENSRVSYIILNDTPHIDYSSDTVENVNFTLESVEFSGVNCYMRLHIKNMSSKDYLVGPMNIKWIQSAGKTYSLYPCFITAYPSLGFRTSFPVLSPGMESTVVLATRAVNVKDDDLLILTIGDRLYKINLTLTLTGKFYNEEMALAR